MPLLLCSVLLFCFAVGHGVASYTPVNEGFVKVTEKDQLWRFAVGEGGYRTVGMGDRYICLHRKGYFIQAYLGKASLGGGCVDSARFEVEFVRDNEVMLKLKGSDKYLSCASDATVRAVEWRDETSKFELTISPDGEEVVLYNPSADGTLSSRNGHDLDCSGYRTDRTSRFYGWKLGPKEAWQPSNRWEMIGYFDNRRSSSRTKKYHYTTSIGVETTDRTEARVAEGVKAWISSDLYIYFVKYITDPIVEWEDTTPDIWQRKTTGEQTIEVRPHKLTKVFQAVGHYGVFVIRSRFIQARDEKSGNVQEYNLLPV